VGHDSVSALHKLAAIFPDHLSKFLTPRKYLEWYASVIEEDNFSGEECYYGKISYFKDSSKNSISTESIISKEIQSLDITDVSKDKAHQLIHLLALIILERMNPPKSLNHAENKLLVKINKGISNNKALVSFDENLKEMQLTLPKSFHKQLTSDPSTYQNNLSQLVFQRNVQNGDKNEINIDEFLSSETSLKFKDEIIKLLDSPAAQFIYNEYHKEFSKLAQLLSLDKDSVGFIVNSAILEAYLMPNGNTYEIFISKFNSATSSRTTGKFFICSENDITVEMMNILDIAHNIALNTLGHISSYEYPDNGKTNIGLNSSSPNNLEEINYNQPYISKKMKRLDFEITKYARSNVHILITGETGVGKDMIAKIIHQRSHRSKLPFITVSLKSLSQTLLESELFGYEKGAFTGADEKKIGKFEGANGGTLYLPEISDISTETQIKLLEFLQEGFIYRVGSGASPRIKVDVRLIFASNENLEKLMEKGKIRKDFYYRIKVLTLDIPPLRERKEDIPLLAEKFTTKYSVQLTGKEYSLHPDVYPILMEREWKGNVRELENSVIQAIIKTEDEIIRPENFSFLSRNCIDASVNDENLFDYKNSRVNFKKSYFKKILKETNGNVSKASKIAGISRQALYKIIDEYNIEI
jgi:transcriptional regulator with PAS, ATPase and Fis domain